MRVRSLFVFFIVVLTAAPFAFASSPVSRAVRHEHADRNDDGVVSARERHVERTWEHNRVRNVNTWWENRADTDNNGKVSAGELSAWKSVETSSVDINHDGTVDAKERRRCWLHARSKVNTSVEAKYDVNNDGWLEASEVREMLQAKYALIKSDGKAKVDTDIEAEYDTNNDGVLDVGESKAMNEDLAS